MKTPIGILLALGLGAAALFAQAEPDAPGKGLDLSSPAAPATGPLTPAVSLDEVPGASVTPAQEDDRPVVVDSSVKEALAGKSDEQQQQFVRLLTEASQLVQKDEIQSALEFILEAEAIESDYFALHNLKGAAFSKIRAFDKATASFKRCLELNPGSVEAQFNLAEMDFVQKNYTPALDAFSAILTENPRMASNTRNLLRFKMYLCLLMLDRSKEAEAISETFRFDSDTPEYYLANAAKNFQADDKEEANGWLGSANRIYNRGLVNLYLDSLIEIGWVNSL